MRITILIFFLLIAPSAFARMDPGPPPWSCDPLAACDGSNSCVPISGLPLSFNLRAIGKEQNRFILKGFDSRERLAAIFSSKEQARIFVEDDNWVDRVSVILIPNKEIADSRNFWAHGVLVRGTGERVLRPEHLLISCGRIPRG